jgi:hypothetical protein
VTSGPDPAAGPDSPGSTADPGGVPDDGYRGPATLVLDGTELTVQVDLRGHFQPIDGRFHWYGRIAADAELDRLVDGNRATGLLRTPTGQGTAELADPDLWGRFRISGQSTPPFALDTTIPTG